MHYPLNKINIILIKIPATFFFADLHKLILKFIQKCRGSRIAKKYLEKRTKFTLFYFKIFYIATVIKVEWLTWGETQRSTEFSWKPKNKPLNLWSVGFRPRCQNNSMGIGYSFQKLDILMQNNKLRLLTQAFQKN